MTGVLLQDHEVRKSEFQQLSYHRVLIMLLLELNAPEPELETINFQVLTAFCNVLHILRPEKAPGFAYAWLDVVSHRVFIGRMLAVTPQHKGWGPYAQLLIDLFHFLSPFLRNAELARPIAVLYKGCLRVLLVLLHDFPEFLCDYHYNFCDAIPPNCIQVTLQMIVQHFVAARSRIHRLVSNVYIDFVFFLMTVRFFTLIQGIVCYVVVADEESDPIGFPACCSST